MKNAYYLILYYLIVCIFPDLQNQNTLVIILFVFLYFLWILCGVGTKRKDCIHVMLKKKGEWLQKFNERLSENIFKKEVMLI